MVAITRSSDVSIAFHRIPNRALGTMAAQPDPELSGMTGVSEHLAHRVQGHQARDDGLRVRVRFSAVSFY
jgi:hypothetical protein